VLSTTNRNTIRQNKHIKLILSIKRDQQYPAGPDLR
jgi:hypothetical protein